jgi:hypothetical protein
MGDHLKVDMGMLADTAGELRGLVSEFNGVSRFGEDSGSAVGHPSVIDALDEFASNWKRHREKLTKHLDAVAQMAEDSEKTYRETDDKLAQSLEEAGKAS